MKNQLKIYLKNFILLFGISFLLLNCEKEEIVQFENQQTFSKTYKVISLEKIERLKLVILNIKKVKPIKQDEFTKDLSFLNAIENLNTDEISQYTNETGYSSYSFKFNNVEEGAINFENLQLLETTNDGYIAYILSYEPNPDWYYDNLNSDGTLNLDISTYEGELTKYSLEREVIWTTKNTGEVQAKGSGGFATFCTYSLVSACNMEDYDCGGSECGYTVEESCTTVYVGGSGTGDNPENGDTSDGTGGSNTSDEGPCNNVEGTPIVDDQPLSGIDGGCAPNNNNGTSNNNTLQTFYQGLSPAQQSFLSSNQAIYNQIGDYLNNNSFAPQAISIAGYMVNAGMNNTLVTVSPFFKYPDGSDYAAQYPEFTYLIKEYIPSFKNNIHLINTITQLTNISAEDVVKNLTWDKGPEIHIEDLGYSPDGSQIKGKFNPSEPDKIYIDKDLVDYLENFAIANGETNELGAIRALVTFSVCLHELVHYADYDFDGLMQGNVNLELGLLFEKLYQGGYFEFDTNGEVVFIKLN